ncbi:hypothetical protein FRC20_005738 [Serendipita sp. 405]|nr:hypothetical protein FRC15_005707 [Serendipita sp. 397]KAG8840185.1 hypothetical protein FRC20_005738 [Serendipita sp. 405]
MEYWHKVISICAEAEVDLVNSKSTLIHLWNDQHQLVFMTDQEGNDGPEATEEEDGSLDAEEWYEQSSPDDFPLVYGDEDEDKDEDNGESKDQEDIGDEGEEDDKDEEGEEGNKDDNKDDPPYIYTFQPDILPYTSSSDALEF